MRKGHTEKTSKAKKQTKLSPDELIKTTTKGSVELTEEDLKSISGGLNIDIKLK
jgi:bacteriocin-like protein